MTALQSPMRRVAMLSVHTSPLAVLGQAKTGGMNVYVRELSRELARRGVAVDVFTRAVASPEVTRPELTVQPDRRVDGFRVVHLPAGPAQPLATDDVAGYLPQFVQGVAGFAQADGLTYDLLHSHYWLSGLAAQQLRRRWGRVPLVHMFHTLGPMKSRIASSQGELASAARIRAEAQIVRFADRLVAATPAEKEQLQRFFRASAGKIVGIPPGVDLSRFRRIPQKAARQALGLNPDRRLVLTVGRIEALKGLDTLLQAMALLRQGYPALGLTIDAALIGGDPHRPEENPEMARLLALHRKLGLGDSVRFLGAKHQEEIAQYYAAADVVAMPSLYESFGMVALEAMAMGTPVIAADVGGLSHLVDTGETGYLISPRAPDALAHRLLELFLDERARLRMGCYARQKAQQYGWPQITDRIADVYAELTGASIPAAA